MYAERLHYSAAFAECWHAPVRGAVRFYGGISFIPESPQIDPWSAFGDAYFMMPRWLYTCTGATASLTLTLGPGEHHRGIDQRPPGIEQVLAEYDDLCQAFDMTLRNDEPSARVPNVLQLRWTDPIERTACMRLVLAARDAIEHGDLQKVAVAQTARATLSARPALHQLVGRLNAAYPQCTRFMMRADESCFMGATPERLVRRTGQSLYTEALAASAIPSARGHLDQPKELREHDFVVQDLSRRLAEWCDDLHVPEQPHVRELGYLVHLVTPIEARLKHDIHVLELVDALHPTPAVGGVPRQAALEWIASHEPSPRGWYAAPLGWFDQHGNGDFVVGLRSWLLTGTDALVYTGAGIVAESDAAAEYEEMKIKQQVFLSAFGALADQ